MTLARTTFAALIVTLGSFSTQAEASYFSIDRSARLLQRQAATLYWEFNEHYSYSAHYPHLRRDSRDMYYLAKHIHELAHHRYGLRHMALDLQRLDRLFHHVENLVAHMEQDALHGIGHVHGHTGHVKSLLFQMGNTLHNLRRDIEEMRRPVVFYPHDRGGIHSGGPGVHGGRGAAHVVWKNGGVSFGPGGFKIRVGG